MFPENKQRDPAGHVNDEHRVRAFGLDGVQLSMLMNA